MVTANSCHGFYDRGTNALYLFNDALTAVMGPLSLGSANTIENSQCTLHGSTSAVVSDAGTDLTVRIGMSRKSTFTGNKNVQQIVLTNAGRDSGWSAVATWNQ
ncbi:MAG: hypothetical protein JNM66_08580 [Bryobacterales bacterium]|nr:hypothetical protein [Bryobacterales bacterium]